MQEMLSLIPASRRSPEEGHGNPLQCFCLRNLLDRGTWQATVPGVPKSQTRLNNSTATTNVMVSVSLLSDFTCALLVYRKIIDFCMLTLYSNVAIITYKFQQHFVNSFRFSIQLVLSSMNNAIFFPQYVHLVLLSLVLLHQLKLLVSCRKAW